MSKGFLSVIIASILFGILPSAFKILQNSGFPIFLINFGIYTACFLIFAVMSALREHSLLKPVTPQSIIQLLSTGAIGMGVMMLLLNSSYRYIPVGTATLIHFTYPVIVVLLMACLFRERLTLCKGFACILSVTGMLLVTDLTFGGKISGILLAFLSGLAYSIYIIMNEKAAFIHMPACQKMTYLSLGAVLFSGILLAASPVPHAFHPTIFGTVILLLGALADCTAFLLLTYGIRRIGASRASFATMLEPVTSVICGILFFRDSLSIRGLAGIVLVLSSMLLIDRE